MTDNPKTKTIKIKNTCLCTRCKTEMTTWNDIVLPMNDFLTDRIYEIVVKIRSCGVCEGKETPIDKNIFSGLLHGNYNN